MAKLSSYLRGSTTTTGISTSSNLVIGSDTSTGTADQNLQVSGGSYISGNTGIGSAIPQSKLDVAGDTLVSGISTASEFSLSSIDSSITDTAVDVFVYDTRKDSDGGAWRKRTQHTSWYNETLNTATRGSRREFPAVAVLVSTSTTLTIYDGDDPDMPMWLNYGSMNSNSESPKALYAKNGIIAWAGEYGLYYSNYIEDRCRQILTSASRFRGDTGIRIGDVINTSDAKRIVNNTCNDVAMTVLPNAPVDSATGLPVPTIAVATDGGTSIIKDDGTVVSGGEANSSWKVNKIFIDSYYNIWGVEGTDYSPGIQLLSTLSYSSVADIGTGTLGYQLTTQATTAYGRNTSWPFILGGYGSFQNEHAAGKEYIFNGATLGLTFLQDNTTNRSSSMVAYASTSYNTGWMHGNIKGAFLADTDDTNVTGTELVTNGTFDSNTTGWTANSNATISVDTQRLKFEQSNSSGPAYVSQGVTTVVGKSYVVNLDFTAGTQSNVQIYIGTSLYGAQIFQTFITSSPYTKTFIATSTTTYITFRHSTGTTGRYCFLDNISVRIADPDRSVNKNGLQVFGTITKSPVAGSGATAAELVAYGPFSTSNYLLQPNNTDLDYGTGDFYYMGWFYNTSVSARQMIFRRNLTNGTLAAGRIICSLETNGNFFFSIEGGGTNKDLITTSWSQNVWNHFCVVRSGTDFNLYINGVVKNSETGTNYSVTCTNAVLTVGILADDFSSHPATSTSITLLRTGASAPSAEQIKKIYEDEKVLFQENAACTLYGSSDAVTALAYDDSTNLLYAGTSSGRSDFQGLRRINNTTTAVTTAISASNGLVAEQ